MRAGRKFHVTRPQGSIETRHYVWHPPFRFGTAGNIVGIVQGVIMEHALCVLLTVLARLLNIFGARFMCAVQVLGCTIYFFFVFKKLREYVAWTGAPIDATRFVRRNMKYQFIEKEFEGKRNVVC